MLFFVLFFFLLKVSLEVMYGELHAVQGHFIAVQSLSHSRLYTLTPHKSQLLVFYTSVCIGIEQTGHKVLIAELFGVLN